MSKMKYLTSLSIAILFMTGCTTVREKPLPEEEYLPPIPTLQAPTGQPPEDLQRRIDQPSKRRIIRFPGAELGTTEKRSVSRRPKIEMQTFELNLIWDDYEVRTDELGQDFLSVVGYLGKIQLNYTMPLEAVVDYWEQSPDLVNWVKMEPVEDVLLTTYPNGQERRLATFTALSMPDDTKKRDKQFFRVYYSYPE